MDRIQLMIQEIHGGVNVDRLIQESLPNIQSLRTQQQVERVVQNCIRDTARIYLVPQNAGRTLGDILPAIITEPVEYEVKAAFWDNTPMVVAEYIMSKRQADVAVVATDQERYYIRYALLQGIIIGLQQSLLQDTSRSLTQVLGPGIQGLLIEQPMHLAFTMARDNDCAQLTCYQCVVNPEEHVFSDPPDVNYCPWPDYPGHCFAPVIQLNSTELCCD